MQNTPVVIEPVGDDNHQAVIEFLAGWVSDGEAGARAYLTDHCGEAAPAWSRCKAAK